MLRKKLAVLVAMAMMLALASPALVVPGNGQGVGQGMGGGDISHVDNGTKTRPGGGPLNNPHVGGGCEVAC